MSRNDRDGWLMLPVYLVLGVFAVVTLAPFFWLLCGSLKTRTDFFDSIFFPVGDGFLGVAWDQMTGENFARLFTELGFFTNVVNSVFLASVTSLLATLFSAMAGFALAKMEFKGRRFITGLVLAALIIPPPLLLASGFQVLYEFGLLNRFAGLIVPALSPAFGIFLFRQAMLNAVPNELLDAARIDGCGDFQTFFIVVLPLVRPMVATFLLLTFLGTWNNFIQPQIVLQDTGKFPLSVAISQLRGLYLTDYGMISAGTLVSILPIAALFLIMQREFISGLTAGSVKG